MANSHTYGDSTVSQSEAHFGDNIYNTVYYNHYHTHPTPQEFMNNQNSSASYDWKEAFGKRCHEKKYDNWSASITDLLKGCGLASDFNARIKLADVLGVHEAKPGNPDQNIALHTKVMSELDMYHGELSPLLLVYKSEVSKRRL